MLDEKDIALPLELTDVPPSSGSVTDYDREHAPLYLRMLDADLARAPWEDVARRLLRIDPQKDRERARLRYETHLARARWVRDSGYPELSQNRPS